MFALLSLTGAIPALLAMAYFDWLDRKRPEPPGTLRRVAAGAALLVIPVVPIELLLLRLSAHMQPIPRSFFEGFVAAAAVEEAAKIVAVLVFAWRRPEFDERMDGIAYGARAGLGFALLENVGYLAGVRSLSAFVAMFVLRGIFSVPMHAVSGAIAGYFGARKRFDGKGPGFLGGWVFAVLLHGSFDASIFLARALAKQDRSFAVFLGLFGLFLVIPFGLWLRKLAARALDGDDRDARLSSARPPPSAP